MKTVLIVAGIIVFLVYGFVLYCCIRVGKESDEQYNKLREGKEQEDDRSRSRFDCRLYIVAQSA